MRDELQDVLRAARELPVEQLPHLLGELEQIRCTAMARLVTPTPLPEHDKLIDVATAAQRLGVSEDYVYRHHRQYPFTRRMGKRLLFSSLGIERHIRQCRQ